MNDEFWMQKALELADTAEASGEAPVGCLLVRDGEMIGSGFNQTIKDHDPSAHAEIVAMRAAGKGEQNYRLPGTTLYVTLEPCTMCLGAMVHGRIERLVYGASDPKTGAAGGKVNLLDSPAHNHRMVVQGGVLGEECSSALKAFFQRKRKS